MLQDCLVATYRTKEELNFQIYIIKYRVQLHNHAKIFHAMLLSNYLPQLFEQVSKIFQVL
jgi:hypothetical protein